MNVLFISKLICTLNGLKYSKQRSEYHILYVSGKKQQ